jgi:aldose sugar dehydrogenase
MQSGRGEQYRYVNYRKRSVAWSVGIAKKCYKERICLNDMTKFILLLFAALVFVPFQAFAQNDEEEAPSGSEISSSNINLEPNATDQNLKIEVVTKGLDFPTSMAFLGPNDILVSEKNQGTVKRIVGSQILEEPLLDVNVATNIERGMLGITIAKNVSNEHRYVFLYFTESEGQDGEDLGSEDGDEGKTPLGNRLYRYELVNNKLINPKLLLDLPAFPHPAHNGGKLTIGPDNNIYLAIGDIKGYKDERSITKAQNVIDGTEPDGRAGILRMTLDGEPVPDGAIIGDNAPLNFYYAYGIRNSFGMDFDPITGNLWDTENGPGYGDEINLVEPGFNSGWMKVQGIWVPDEELRNWVKEIGLEDLSELEDFDGRGKYSPPRLAWEGTVGLTALKFLHSNKLGEQYENDMFVADFNGGNIYHFDLSANRTGIALRDGLTDTVANSAAELQNVTLAQGFGSITDMEVGPDGYLYVLSLYLAGYPCNEYEETDCLGTIFRISTKS